MPNWTYSTIRIKGNKENILNFINEGLKNSGFEPMNDIDKAFDKLCDEGKTQILIKPNGLINKATIGLKKGVTMGTFLPSPDTFLLYDTTNSEPNRDSVSIDWDGNIKNLPMFESDEDYNDYITKYRQARKLQMDKYGAVGWYDYNCDVRFGCKWNADLSDFVLNEYENDIYVFGFECQTAWTTPSLFLEWIKDNFGVNVFICAFEESNMFNYYGEIDGEDVESIDDFSVIDGYPDEEDYKDENGELMDDEYYEEVFDVVDTYKEGMKANFETYVEKYKIDEF